MRALTLVEVQECVACCRRACSKKSGKVRGSKSNISLYTHHSFNSEGSFAPPLFTRPLPSQSSCLSLIVNISSIDEQMGDHTKKIIRILQIRRCEGTVEAESIAVEETARENLSMGRVASSCQPQKSHGVSGPLCGGMEVIIRV